MSSAVEDITFAQCSGTFAVFEWRPRGGGKRVKDYRRLHLLHTAPDVFLGPFLVGELAAWFANRAGYRLHDPETFREEFRRYMQSYVDRARLLPEPTLAERRAFSEQQLRAYASEVTSLAWRFTWVIELARLAAIAFRCPFGSYQKIFRSWPSHKKADAARIWVWRQSAWGKASTRRYRAKKDRTRAARAA